MNKDFLSISLVVLFSIVLWVFVSLSREYSTDIETPLEISQLPEGYTVGYISDKNISMNLRGQGWQLTSVLFGRTFNYQVSANFESGNHSVMLRNRLSQNSWIPDNVQVMDIQPLAIEFDVEEKDTIKVPIDPKINLDFYPGFNLVSEMRLYPDSIIVIGAKSKIKDLNSVETNYTEFTNLRDQTSAMLEILPIEDLYFQTTVCRIEFDVQKIVDLTFDDIKVEIRDIPAEQDLILFPENIRVSVSGGIDILSQLKKEDIVAYLKFSDAESDTVGALIPVVETPQHTSLLNFRPKKLNYIIKRY